MRQLDTLTGGPLARETSRANTGPSGGAARCGMRLRQLGALRHTASNFGQLSKTQADAVMRIALFGPASMTELASGLGVSKKHVTCAVAGLEEQGLVTKRRNAENRRIVEAVLTEKGEEAVTAIRLASIERLEKPLSSLSPAERDELVDLSTRAVALLLRIRLG